MKLLPFIDARKFVHKLKLKGSKDWIEYCKSGKKPDGIPYSPDRAYKYYWKGWSDWLGTITPRELSYRPFEQAREFVHRLDLKTRDDWNQYCKSGKKPVDIPNYPNQTYKRNWKGIGDWLGTNRVANSEKQFLPFHEARNFVRSLGLKNAREWEIYRKAGKKPSIIPTNPNRTYKKEWRGIGDWLGSGTVSPHYLQKHLRPYDEAREFIRSLCLKSRRDWNNYCKSGKKPKDIPSAPHVTYREVWKGYGDWLGSGTIAPQNRRYRPFEVARRFVRELKLRNEDTWRKYSKSLNKPGDIPGNPNVVYDKDWKGIGDWLGTGNVAPRNRKYRAFEEARQFVCSLKLKSAEGWRRYCKSGKKPNDIPSAPERTYKRKWKGIGDWLGTGYIAPKYRQYRPYEQAKKFVHSLNLTGQDQWEDYCKSGSKPQDIPTAPVGVYKSEWKGWWDWLGHEGSTWTIYKVKALLRDLISSKVIYEWDEAVLYSFLLRKGVLSLHDGNQHSKFFKNLIEASKTELGKKSIEEYAYSDSERPPDISGNVQTDPSDSEEIETASLSDLSSVVEETDVLDYGDIKSVEQILEHTNLLESINVDEEAMQFYLDYSVDELWRRAFKNEADTVRKVKEIGKNGNKYHDTVIDTFLDDYEASTKLDISSGYSFPYAPTLMQRYVAHKVISLPYFGNFSGTGAGKTLSAILASRVIESGLTVIVCPNDVVEQWKRNILDTFPNSKVITGKDAFHVQNSEIQYQYAVLNYDKFSQEDSPNLILNLAKLIPASGINPDEYESFLKTFGSSLSTSKPIVLVEGMMDKQLLEILFPDIGLKCEIICLEGKGKIQTLMDAINKLTPAISKINSRIFAILDKDREKVIEGKQNLRNKCMILPVYCLENFVLNSKEIYEELMITSKDMLVSKNIISENKLSQFIDYIIQSQHFKNNELVSRMREELSFHFRIDSVIVDEINDKLDEVVSKKKDKMVELIQEKKALQRSIIQNKKYDELNGKEIFSYISKDFGVDKENFVKHVAEKIRKNNTIRKELQDIIRRIVPNEQ